jgi:hypothetical protein
VLLRQKLEAFGEASNGKLSNSVNHWQEQKTALVFEVDCFKGEKERLEAAVRTNKVLLQEILTQKLMVLKFQRPNLFTINGEEQIARLIAALMRNILI